MNLNAFLHSPAEMADEPERGARCQKCIHLRLEEAVKTAKSIGSDYFATTLTLSPHKDTEFINQDGFSLAETYDLPWLPSDFKKKEGYQAFHCAFWRILPVSTKFLRMSVFQKTRF